MTQSRRTHDPTPAATIEAMKEYQNAAITANPSPSPDGLLTGLPQGSLRDARVTPKGLIAFTIRDLKGVIRNERFIEPEGFALLRILTLFSGGAYFNANRKGRNEHHFIKLFSATGQGITFQRLLTSASRGKAVTMKEDHHYLTATNLELEGGNAKRGRQEAYAAALNEYDKRAVLWGLAETLSRDAYHAMMSEAFRLYDLKHGHNYLRESGDKANTAPAA